MLAGLRTASMVLAGLQTASENGEESSLLNDDDRATTAGAGRRLRISYRAVRKTRKQRSPTKCQNVGHTNIKIFETQIHEVCRLDGVRDQKTRFIAERSNRSCKSTSNILTLIDRACRGKHTNHDNHELRLLVGDCDLSENRHKLTIGDSSLKRVLGLP